MIEALEKENGDFCLVEVNGMRLADPSHVYSEIHAQLMGKKKLSAGAALGHLNAFFTDGDGHKRATVLLVDEVG